MSASVATAEQRPRPGAPVAVPLGLLVAVAALVAAGHGSLAPPPLDPTAWGGWIEERGGVVAALALVRLAALGVAALWAALAVAVLLARAAGAFAAAALLARGLPRALARALAPAGLASALLLAVPVAAPTTALAGPPPAAAVGGPGTATMRLVVDDPPAAPTPPATTAPTTTAPTSAPATSAPTTTPAPTTASTSAPVATASTSTTGVAEPPPASAPAAGSTPEVVPAGEWVVAPGESFWSVAEAAIAGALGRPPADDEVAPYWAQLVEANRARLLTGDPDVIVPGQRFVQPSP